MTSGTYTATHEIVKRTRLSARSVRRLLARRPGHVKGEWNKRSKINPDAVVVAVEIGRQRCHNHPCRYIHPDQLSLF